MSTGTLVALTADEIEVDPNVAMGPVDSRIGEYPAASIVAAYEEAQEPGDKTLILADASRGMNHLPGFRELGQDPAAETAPTERPSSSVWHSSLASSARNAAPTRGFPA